jgi:phosphotransferase system IIB component
MNSSSNVNRYAIKIQNYSQKFRNKGNVRLRLTLLQHHFLCTKNGAIESVKAEGVVSPHNKQLQVAVSRTKR